MKKRLIFTPVQWQYIFIQGCSIKYWKGWDFEYATKKLFTPASWSCIFIPVPWAYSFIPVQWSGHAYLSLFSSPVGAEKAAYGKGWKWEKNLKNEEKAHIHPCFLNIHICPCSVIIHIYPRLLHKLLKRMRLWIHGQKAPHPCSLILHIYPCSHLQLEQKRLLNKIYKNMKWEKIGIHEENAHIHPCALIIHICPCAVIIHIYPRLLKGTVAWDGF